jgi:acetoin utilization protein AcuC
LTDKVAIFYDPKFLQYNLGPNHPLRQERIMLHYELCRTLGLLKSPTVIEPQFNPATEDQVQLVHSQSYIDQVRELSRRDGYSVLDMGDTSAFPGAFDVTSLAVGATLACVDTVMKGTARIGWNPAGGLHHARPDQAAGFCIFNDVAIACRFLQHHHGLERILYLDIDVHHGDGVQEIFYDDPGVLTLSIHETGRTLYPGTGFPEELGEGKGKGYSVNVPLPPYTTDELYLQAFQSIVPPIIKAYQPEAIVMQSGVDTHFQDQLGHLRVTTATFTKLASLMVELANRYTNGRLITVGGGGYSFLSVPRCWTLMFGEYVGVAVSDEIPKEWQELFHKTTGLEAPRQVRDHKAPPLTDSVHKQIQKVVTQSIERVKQLAFPLLGIKD